MTIIGQVRSPFKEKFSVPRQPNLASAVTGKIHFFSPFNQPACFNGLEQFSHIWIQFIFDQTAAQGWKAAVRPPRLGGNKKMGVFATRSPFRPNPIGLSCVKLESIEVNQNQEVSLLVSGLDLVDNTPVVDIKPYVPYADCLTAATSEFSPAPPELMNGVIYSQSLQLTLARIKKVEPAFCQVVEQVLLQDPRPAYMQNQDSERLFGLKLFNWNIRWYVENGQCIVTEITDLD